GISQVIGGGLQRPEQDIEDRRGKGEADRKTRSKADRGIDQPCAKLQQVLHQRRLGRVERRLVFGTGLDHGAGDPAAAAGGAAPSGDAGAGAAGSAGASLVWGAPARGSPPAGEYQI